MQLTGQVESVVSRPTKIGDMWDVVINGKKYSYGTTAPRGLNEGDFVSFEYEIRKNGQYTNYNIKKGSLRQVEDTGDVATPAQTSAKPERAAGGKSSYVPYDERQEIISKQSALNTAQNFLNFAAAQGVLPLPKSAKDGDKLTMLKNWLLDEAASVYNLATGRTWDLPTVEAAVPEKPKAAARKPKPEPEEEDTGYDEYNDEIPF